MPAFCGQEPFTKMWITAPVIHSQKFLVPRCATFADGVFMASISEPLIALDQLLSRQDGVLDARTVLAYLSPAAIRWRVRSGRWQQPCRGVLVTHSGPLTDGQLLWVATLWAGSGAALAGLTAARLGGLRGFDNWTDAIHLLVPASHTMREIRPPLRLAVHYSRNLTPTDIHPVREPPQTKIARSLVDAAAWAGTDRGAQAVLAAGVQQRLVRVADLAAEVKRNERVRRRKLMHGDRWRGAHGRPAVLG
jgi:hypothetical protein